MLNKLRNKKMLAAWVMVLGLAGAGVACDGDDAAGDDVIIEDEQEGADLNPDIEETIGEE